jgi:hypothetical protein
MQTPSANDLPTIDSDPVPRLLAAGTTDICKPGEWPDYPTELGIGQVHVDALIELAGG